jgi:hypothetical protein
LLLSNAPAEILVDEVAVPDCNADEKFAKPEEPVSMNRLEPILTRPSGLLKLAS